MFKLKNNTNFVSNYETIRFRSASAALTDNAAKSTQIPELPGLHFSPTLDPKYFISTLFKCRNASQIKQVHAHVSTNGMLHCLTMANKLLYSYTQQKDLVNAYALFGEIKEKDPVSWSVMIGGFSKVGDFRHCFETFRELMRNGAQPDSYNLPFVIRVCRDELGVSMGRLVHCIVLKNGLHLDHFVCAALVDMYAKCGMIEEGKKVFDKMPKRDLVTWTVMISALSECGNAEESWALFDNMRAEGVFPDKIAMVTIVNACAKLGVMHKASVVHEYIVRNNFSLDVILGTAMIDMYAKCGSVDLAREIFDMMQRKNVISWSAMIAAYGYHGQGRKALDLFHMMLSNETLPNNITFVSLLYACSHAGLVEDGLQIFSLMQGSYGVVPDVKHYTCMVDLLGRAGKVNEAFGLIDNISVKKDEGLWCALLGACRIHKHVDLAEKAAQSLLDLQPQNPGYYVLLSNIYANAGKWKDVAKMRDLLTKRGLKKIPGYTWIEIDNIVYRFSVGDKTHPQSKEIYGMLKVLTEKLELAGYVPDTNFVLHDVDEEVKVGILSTHSEKLAIAFGVLATKEDTPIRITKNLRVCGDCHTFIKLVSTITQREIVVRDANRFHHFKEGACSCDDYWLQFLDPGESVIMISMVKKLQKLTSKKVQLIVTDKPKFIYVDPSKLVLPKGMKEMKSLVYLDIRGCYALKLILTDKPKFIYVDPSKLVVKGNIIWSDNSNDLSVQVTTHMANRNCGHLLNNLWNARSY